jgi:hypothetical protein
MRWYFFLIALLAASPAAAQSAARFDPAAEYITPGQDEPGYQQWVLAAPDRAAQVRGLYGYLLAHNVGGVVPTWQLTRTATSWRSCGAQPFEVPPESEWPNLVETLKYVRDHIIPVVGPVEPVSVYRNEVLNVCAGGAADSAHRHFFALDLVPLRPTTRDALMRGVCAIHSWQGGGYEVGLGFYKGLRFHVDSKKYRKWGAAMGDEVTIGCPQLMAEIAAQAAASRAAMQVKSTTAPASTTPAIAPITDPLAPMSMPPVEATPPPVETPAVSSQP